MLATPWIPRALSLGLLNGDLFTYVIAFSPGFVTEGSRRGKPAEIARAALDWLARG